MGGEPPLPGDLTPGEALPAALLEAVPAPLPEAVPPPPPVYSATTGGMRLRWPVFVGGVFGLVLGAIAVRCAAILSGRIDPDLVTTPELEAFARIATLAQLGLIMVSIATLMAGSRWTSRMRASLVTLTDDQPLLETARRTGRLALGMAVGSLVLLALGSVLLFLPIGRDPARVGWLLTAAGGLLLPVATGLLIWLIGDIERRERLLIHALHPWQQAPGDRDRRWPMATMALLAVLAVIPPAANVPYLFSDRVCQSTQLECRWILVQADQLDDDPREPTMLLDYGLHRAAKERVGTLVVATGGPGVSGIATADDTLARFDSRLTDTYDIVLFDARGVGDSGYVDCPGSSGRYQSSLWFDARPAVIEDFVDSCLAETGVDQARLDEYGSAQLAEDIDTIRRDLGVDRIALYAESYGTVAAQRYAVAHPDHLSALILDGAIDIAQPTDASWIEATRGFDDVLRRTLATCGSTPGCRFNDTSVWNNVLHSLELGPVTASYAGADGDVTAWPLTAEIVRDTLIDAMYDVSGRMLAMRALSAAEAGDWVPLARLVYSGTGPGPSTTVSDFAYYATSCADRLIDGPDTDAATYLSWLKRSPFATSPAGSVYLSSAACHSWPLAPATSPPAAVPAAADFPVVILAATGDPITPPTHAERIFERYRSVTDTYLIETSDGPHVTFGRGSACPDDAVVALLSRATRPSDARSSCPGEIVAPYLEFADSARSSDPIAFRAAALDLELLAHPDYWTWDGAGPLTVGCRYGGRLQVSTSEESDETVERIDVDRCAIVAAEPLDGAGVYRGTDEAQFDVHSSDVEFTYRIVGADRYTKEEDHVSAVWDGRFRGRQIDGRR
jgi:pimeloyl-ACP methyl ester carboxylesterase